MEECSIFVKDLCVGTNWSIDSNVSRNYLQNQAKPKQIMLPKKTKKSIMNKSVIIQYQTDQYHNNQLIEIEYCPKYSQFYEFELMQHIYDFYNQCRKTTVSNLKLHNAKQNCDSPDINKPYFTYLHLLGSCVNFEKLRFEGTRKKTKFVKFATFNPIKYQSKYSWLTHTPQKKKNKIVTETCIFKVCLNS